MSTAALIRRRFDSTCARRIERKEPRANSPALAENREFLTFLKKTRTLRYPQIGLSDARLAFILGCIAPLLS